MHEFKPDDIVKSCDAIEAGCRLHPEGMGCCYKLPVMSPIIVTSDEINSPEFSHEMIVNKRRQLFEALNGLNIWIRLLVKLVLACRKRNIKMSILIIWVVVK